MKNVNLVLCMVMFLASHVFAQSRGEMSFTGATPESNALFRKAVVAYFDARFSEGDSLINALLAKDPSCGIAYPFLHAETNDEFYAHVQTALSKKLSDDEILLINGFRARRANEPVTQYFDPLLKKYSHDKYLHLMIMFNSNEADGVKIGEALVKRYPKFAPAYNMLGYQYLALKNMPKAEANFDKYMSLQPDLANVYDSKGDYMVANKRYSEAVTLFNKAASMGFRESGRKAEYARARVQYPDLSAADKDQIRAMLNQSAKTNLSGNVEAMLSMFADQTLEIMPNQVANVGLPNLRHRVHEMLKGRSIVKDEFKNLVIEGLGSIALVQATELRTFRYLESGKEETTNVDVIFLLRKNSQGWKIMAFHWHPIDANSTPIGDADTKEINMIFTKYSSICKNGQPLTEKNFDVYEKLYSKQAVEIFPGITNIGNANLRARWSGFFGAKVDYLVLEPQGVQGFANRAIAWGVGEQNLTFEGSPEPVKFGFPWASILTKEADGVWRILLFHDYTDDQYE